MKKIKTLTVILVLTICCGVFMWNCDDSNEAPSNTKTENEYTVTVINGTADKTKAYAKDTVTLLTYTLPDGQAVEFSDWTIDPSTVVMTSGNKFTMPSANVTVTANFTAYDPEANRPYYITNNFGQDSSRDLLVQWHNKTDIPAQTLQIVAAAGSFNNPEKTITVTGNKFSATNTEAPFIGDFESRNVFKADVTGLKANTFYKYRMGTEGAWSEVFYHQTSRGSAAGFSFTVVADPQSSYSSYNTDNLNGHTEEEMYKVLTAANTFDSDNRFFLMLGDIVNEIGKRPDEIVSYTGIANKFNKERPIIATQGNHDTYRTTGTDQYVFGEATVFNNFVTFPDNGWDTNADKANRSQSYYFYYNKVLVIVLNTMATQNATGTAEPNHAAQATWLKNLLEKDKTEGLSNFRIVGTHVSPFGGRSSERWLQPEVRKAYGKIFTDFNVDIVFAGHDHVYGRSNPIKIDSSTSISSLKPQFAAGTAGGVIYSVASTAGPKYYNLDPSPDRDEYFPGERQKFGGPDQAPGMFINVKVTSSYLTVKAVHGGSGAVIDEYNVPIKK